MVQVSQRREAQSHTPAHARVLITYFFRRIASEQKDCFWGLGWCGGVKKKKKTKNIFHTIPTRIFTTIFPQKIVVVLTGFSQKQKGGVGGGGFFFLCFVLFFVCFLEVQDGRDPRSHSPFRDSGDAQFR